MDTQIMLNTVQETKRIGYKYEMYNEWQKDANYIIYGSIKKPQASYQWDSLSKKELLEVINVTGPDKIFLAVCIYDDDILSIEDKEFIEKKHMKNYINDWKKVCDSEDYSNNPNRRREGTTYHLVRFGDCLNCNWEMEDKNIPIFQKARFINRNHPGRMLIPLNRRRHWRDLKMRPSNYIPWLFKKNSIVWRGTTTGKGLRYDYVKTLSELGFNVKFDHACQSNKEWLGPNEVYKGDKMTKRQMMKYKYVLSLEGNDVASNLKWLLSHNSVVIMPTPKTESWLMEGRLLPYVHYVPLDDPNDINKLIKWLSSNDKLCQQIVKNANLWMKQFQNEERTDFINRQSLRLMDEWLNRQFLYHGLYPHMFSSVSVKTVSHVDNV